VKNNNIQQVRRMLAGNNKKSKSYYMGNKKSKDERLAEIRRNKKAGDVWDEDGVEMTLYNNTYMSTKAKFLQETKEESQMPTHCPICNRKMRRRYDKKPWELEGKCWDCVIEEEGKMRIAGTWRSHVEKRLRKNALSQIKDNKRMLEEQLKDFNKKIQFVGNESGELETWTIDQISYNTQRKAMETQITQLNLLEEKLISEEKEFEKNE